MKTQKQNIPEEYIRPQQYKHTPGGKQVCIDHQQFKVKKFIHFVSLVPQINEALILIYPGDHCEPKGFLDNFQKIQQMNTNFQIFMSQINKQKDEKIHLIGLSQNYLNIADNGRQLGFQHLILLYLLKKIQKITFALCFDQECAKQTDFGNIKKTLASIAILFNREQIKQYRNGFMIWVSHQEDNIKKVLAGELKSSLKEGNTLYNQNLGFVKQVITPFLNQERIVELKYDWKGKPMEQKLEQIRQVYKKLVPFNFINGNEQQQQEKLGQKYLNFLVQKSKNLVLKQTDKKQTGQKQPTQKPVQKNINSIKDLFAIWDNYLKSFIKQIIHKIKKGKSSLRDVRDIDKYIFSKPSSKYKLPNLDQHFWQKQFNDNQKQTKAYSSIILLRQLLELYKKSAKSRQNPNKKYYDLKMQQENRILREQFYSMIANCKIININSDQKIFNDLFMVFQELLQLFGNIKQKNKQNKENKENKQNKESESQLFFDITAELIDKKILYHLQTKRVIYEAVEQTCVLRLQSDCKRLQNGQLINGEKVQQAIHQVYSLMEQLKIYQKDKKMIPDFSDRLLNSFKSFEKLMQNQKLKKLQSKPVEKVDYIFEVIETEPELRYQRRILSELGKIVVKTLPSLKQDPHFQIQKCTIKLLEQDFLQNNSLIQQLYEKNFNKILTIRPKTLSATNKLQSFQAMFIRSYVLFYQKMGYTQKARELAYKVNKFDQELCKELLINAANTKPHMQFLKQIAQQNSQPQENDSISEKESIQIDECLATLKENIIVKRKGLMKALSSDN